MESDKLVKKYSGYVTPQRFNDLQKIIDNSFQTSHLQSQQNTYYDTETEENIAINDKVRKLSLKIPLSKISSEAKFEKSMKTFKTLSTFTNSKKIMHNIFSPKNGQSLLINTFFSNFTHDSGSFTPKRKSHFVGLNSILSLSKSRIQEKKKPSLFHFNENCGQFSVVNFDEKKKESNFENEFEKIKEVVYDDFNNNTKMLTNWDRNNEYFTKNHEEDEKKKMDEKLKGLISKWESKKKVHTEDLQNAEEITVKKEAALVLELVRRTAKNIFKKKYLKEKINQAKTVNPTKQSASQTKLKTEIKLPPNKNFNIKSQRLKKTVRKNPVLFSSKMFKSHPLSFQSPRETQLTNFSKHFNNFITKIDNERNDIHRVNDVMKSFLPDRLNGENVNSDIDLFEEKMSDQQFKQKIIQSNKNKNKNGKLALLCKNQGNNIIYSRENDSVFLT